MAEPRTPTPKPRTTPNEHDKPVFQPTTPGKPTPEDPREHEPMRDPPVHPEHDVEGEAQPRDPADNIMFEEDRKPG
jgi:hypothetical protein